MEPAATVFCLFLALAAWMDLRERRVPNALSVPFALLGLVSGGLSGGWTGGGSAVLGLGVGLGMLFVPFALRWFGGGDVKLAAAMGAWLGPRQAFAAVLLAFVLGGVLSAVTWLRASTGTRAEVFSHVWGLVVAREGFQVGPRPAAEKVPFAVALALAGGFVLFTQGGNHVARM